MISRIAAFGPPERVYVENEWYGGPRSGIADIKGFPHRFKSYFDETEDEYQETFAVWPVEENTLRLEVEQWCIFVEWNVRSEAGELNSQTHPGIGGLDPRWDELERLLKNSRSSIPAHALTALAEYERIERASRYELSGPDYMLKWCVL